MTVPAELANTRGLHSFLLNPSLLAMPVEQREGPERRVAALERALAKTEAAGANGSQDPQLAEELRAAKETLAKERQKHRLDDLEWAQKFPSRKNPQRITSVSELQDLADACRSLPVHPTQLYSSVHAILLSGLLSAIFYVRKRHGIVIGLLLVLYPIGRVILEMIRVDNPHDTGGMTIAQSASLAMFITGLVYLIVLYRVLPERSACLTRAAEPE